LTASAQPFGPYPAGTTIFVDEANKSGIEDGTHDHPFDNIQEGIDAAVNGDTVGIAAGVYVRYFRPPKNYVIDGLKNVRLIGMGRFKTVIRSDHTNSLLLVLNGASVMIKDVTIVDGGSLDHSEGGGIRVIGRSPSGYEKVFTYLRVENALIHRNRAVNGGGISVESDARIDVVNTIIANNQAQNSTGGIRVASGATAFIINSNIANNRSALDRTGGILATGANATVTIVNSVIWANGIGSSSIFPPSPQIESAGGGVVKASFSDIKASFSDMNIKAPFSDNSGDVLFPGEGNISVDPLFYSPANSDYHLRSGSPLIDAGTNLWMPSSDFEGLLRPSDGNGDGVAIVDMGAYEFTSPLQLVTALRNTINGLSIHQVVKGILLSSVRQIETLIRTGQNWQAIALVQDLRTNVSSLISKSLLGDQEGEAILAIVDPLFWALRDN
jgi:hypothetical protein